MDVLQPKFQGWHCGTQTIDELGRRKRRRTAVAKKEEAEEAEKNEEWDSLAQCWDCIEWKQEQVEIWRQELKMHELAVAT